MPTSQPINRYIGLKNHQWEVENQSLKIDLGGGGSSGTTPGLFIDALVGLIRNKYSNLYGNDWNSFFSSVEIVPSYLILQDDYIDIAYAYVCTSLQFCWNVSRFQFEIKTFSFIVQR